MRGKLWVNDIGYKGNDRVSVRHLDGAKRSSSLPPARVFEQRNTQAQAVHRSVDTATIRAKLEGLRDLPTPVREWHVQDGLDATDDPAVWIWALIEQSDADAMGPVPLAGMLLLDGNDLSVQVRHGGRVVIRREE